MFSSFFTKLVPLLKWALLASVIGYVLVDRFWGFTYLCDWIAQSLEQTFGINERHFHGIHRWAGDVQAHMTLPTAHFLGHTLPNWLGGLTDGSGNWLDRFFSWAFQPAERVRQLYMKHFWQTNRELWRVGPCIGWFLLWLFVYMPTCCVVFCGIVVAPVVPLILLDSLSGVVMDLAMFHWPPRKVHLRHWMAELLALFLTAVIVWHMLNDLTDWFRGGCGWDAFVVYVLIWGSVPFAALALLRLVSGERKVKVVERKAY